MCGLRTDWSPTKRCSYHKTTSPGSTARGGPLGGATKRKPNTKADLDALAAAENWAEVRPPPARWYCRPLDFRSLCGNTAEIRTRNIIPTLNPDPRHVIAHFQLASLDPGSRRKYRRNFMVPARAVVYLTQKPSTRIGNFESRFWF